MIIYTNSINDATEFETSTCHPGLWSRIDHLLLKLYVCYICLKQT